LSDGKDMDIHALPTDRATWRRGERGLTVIELLIALFLAGIVGSAALHFYKTQHEVYLAQSDIADRQGNLRAALDELARQVRRAGYLVPGGDYLKVSAQFDTLTVFLAKPTGVGVDTIRYFVSRSSSVPMLVKKINTGTANVFAESIDTVLFIPASPSPIRTLAISLVSTPQSVHDGTSLVTRRRLGSTVHLRNRS